MLAPNTDGQDLKELLEDVYEVELSQQYQPKKTAYEPISTGDPTKQPERLAFDPVTASWEQWTGLEMDEDDFCMLASHHRTRLTSDSHMSMLTQLDDMSSTCSMVRFAWVKTLTYYPRPGRCGRRSCMPSGAWRTCRNIQRV